MSTADQNLAFDGLLETLARSVDRDAILGFRVPPDSQARLDDLLERKRSDKLTADEVAELDTFRQLEHVVRLLKARLLANNLDDGI